jgi:hypothetical protein
MGRFISIRVAVRQIILLSEKNVGQVVIFINKRHIVIPAMSPTVLRQASSAARKGVVHAEHRLPCPSFLIALIIGGSAPAAFGPAAREDAPAGQCRGQSKGNGAPHRISDA